MPSAPPSRASTAAATGSGSSARRAWRSVATWSMLTPSRIMAAARSLSTGRVRILDTGARGEVRSSQAQRRRQVRGGFAVAAGLVAELFEEDKSQDQVD